MEAVLLTIALLYMIWSVAVLVFDADIWFFLHVCLFMSYTSCLL
jgi:hypothetical protein